MSCADILTTAPAIGRTFVHARQKYGHAATAYDRRVYALQPRPANPSTNLRLQGIAAALGTVARDHGLNLTEWLRKAWKALLQQVWIGWLLTSISIVVASVGLWYLISNYNNENRPRLSFPMAAAFAEEFPVQNLGNEDAIDITFSFEEVSLQTMTTRAVILEGSSSSTIIWPRLKASVMSGDQIHLHLSGAEFAYLLACATYKSDRGKSFSVSQFYSVTPPRDVPSDPGRIRTSISPATREDDTKLTANFSCSGKK